MNSNANRITAGMQRVAEYAAGRLASGEPYSDGRCAQTVGLSANTVEMYRCRLKKAGMWPTAPLKAVAGGVGAGDVLGVLRAVIAALRPLDRAGRVAVLDLVRELMAE